MTPEEFTKVKEKFAIGPGVAKLNCPALRDEAVPLEKRIVQTAKSTDEENLNKLERAYLTYLTAKFGERIGVQNITLKLAHRCTYTADFSLWSECGTLTLYETKGGFIREDGWIKLKMAARLFPHITFVLVKSVRGGWQESVIRSCL